ncbi:MAG: universal stress protein [Saccharothrix sp.]|nr:universal stress protein [Saccharothrix sp.]
MSEPIVVGVDGSEPALAAARWAATEAARHRVPVKLVHSYQLPAYGYPGFVPTGEEVRQAFEDAAREPLAEAERAVRAVAPEVEVSTSIVLGGAAAVLIEESRHARAVVLGSRGLGGFTGLVVGSVTAAVSAHAGSPVVVLRDQAPAEGDVVVGVDGSEVSEQAVAFAFEQASARGVPLTAVLAWTDSFIDSVYNSPVAVDWSEVEEEQRRLLAERLAGWQEKYPDVPVTRAVVRDRPTRALLRAADGACLLVVGSHGHGGFAGMLLGSTSRALLHHATVPLAIVRRD